MLRAERVSFGYADADAPVLEDIDVAFEPGRFHAILGPNGAGKSTLLRVLAGLLTPTRGTVRLDDQALGALSRRELAHRIAFVPQNEPAVFGFSVREMVAFGRAPHTGLLGTLGGDDERAVDSALARADATHLASRTFGELSGGEQKRVLLARAFAQRAQWLLLDEPVAFLDVKHQLTVCEQIATGVAAKEFTAVVVLHDLNLASQYCDRFLFLSSGRVRASGGVNEVMTYTQIRETFDAEVYVGENELNGSRFFVPMRARSTDGQS